MGRRKRRDQVRHHRRDYPRISSDHASLPVRLPSLRIYPPTQILSTLLDVEDLRNWNPSRVRRPKTLRSLPARIGGIRGSDVLPPGPRSRYRNFFERLRFSYPKSVAICIRRNRRKEIMHAIGRAGRRGRSWKKPRRNEYSNVRC